MKVNLLLTGEELLRGRIVDQNGVYASRLITLYGHVVERMVYAGDNPFHIAHAIKELSSTADLLIISGGLGATGDDVTREALQHLGLNLIESELSRRRLERILRQRGAEPTSRDRRAFLIPEGSHELRNPIGTALGIRFTFGNALVFLLPGVPDEFKAMFHMHIEPVLRREAGAWITRSWTLFGIREVELDEMLRNVLEDLPLNVSFRPSYPLLVFEIAVRADDKYRAEEIAGVAERKIKEVVSPYIFVEGDEEPASTLRTLMEDMNATVAVAESCTGGLLSSLITDVPGASGYFLAGYVTYSPEEKVKVLGVDRRSIEKYGVVSEQVAGEMAAGASRISGAVYSVSTTGYAGPEGGDANNPVGTVYIGVAENGEVKNVQRFFFRGSRERLKKAFALAALFTLYTHVRSK